MCPACKRETLSCECFGYVRFRIVSIAEASNGQCPLEAFVKDSVLCEGQKILVVFWRLSSEAWFAAILYELTTRAYLATLLDKIDLDNFVEKAPDLNGLLPLAELNPSGEWADGKKGMGILLAKF